MHLPPRRRTTLIAAIAGAAAVVLVTAGCLAASAGSGGSSAAAGTGSSSSASGDGSSGSTSSDPSTSDTSTTAAPTTVAPTTAPTSAPAAVSGAGAPTTAAAPAPRPKAPPTTAAPHPPPPPPPPGAGNTGVPAGTPLAPSGGFEVTAAGTVVDAKDITGTVTIAAPNVTIKRCRFTGTGQDYAVNVRSGNVTILDSEIRGGYHTAAVAFDNWTAVRLNVHDLPDDGFKLGSNTLLQDSWVHGFTPEAGAHADGVQLQNGVVNASIVHNTIDIPGGNAALFIAPDLGPSSNGPLVIRDNLLGGGNYSLYLVDGNNGQYYIRSITVSGNRFLRDSRYGAAKVNVPVSWANNAWSDNGGVILP